MDSSKKHTHTHAHTQKKRKKNIPAETGPEPTNPQRPADRRVAPQAPPAEHQVRGEGPARRQGGEEQEAGRAEVVEQLERDDLREDAQGGEGGRGVFWGRRRAARAGHFFFFLLLVLVLVFFGFVFWFFGEWMEVERGRVGYW